MNCKSLLLGLALVAVACGQAPQKKSNLPVYLDDAQPLEARVEDAFSKMTLDEKIAMVHAQSKVRAPHGRVRLRGKGSALGGYAMSTITEGYLDAPVFKLVSDVAAGLGVRAFVIGGYVRDCFGSTIRSVTR